MASAHFQLSTHNRGPSAGSPANVPGVDPLLGAALRLWKRHPPSIALPALAGTIDMTSTNVDYESSASIHDDASRRHKKQVAELEARIEAYMCRTSLRETWLVEDFMCWLSLMSDFESIFIRVAEGSCNAPTPPATPKPTPAPNDKKISIFNRIKKALNSAPQLDARARCVASGLSMSDLYPTSFNGGHRNPFGNHCVQTSSTDPSPFLLHLANVQFQEKVLQQRLQRICAQRMAFEAAKRSATAAVEAAEEARRVGANPRAAALDVMDKCPESGVASPTTPTELENYCALLKYHLESKEEATFANATSPSVKQAAVDDCVDGFGCCTDWVLTIPADASIPVKRTRANIQSFLQWHVLVPIKSTLKPDSRSHQTLLLAREAVAQKRAAIAKDMGTPHFSGHGDSEERLAYHRSTSPVDNNSLSDNAGIFNDLMTVSNFAGSPVDPSSRDSVRFGADAPYERLNSIVGSDGFRPEGGRSHPQNGSGTSSPRNGSSLELMSSRGSVAQYYGFGGEPSRPGEKANKARFPVEKKPQNGRTKMTREQRQEMQRDRLYAFSERLRRRYVSAQSVSQCGVEVILRGDPYWASLPAEIHKGYDVRDYADSQPTSSASRRKQVTAQTASHLQYRGLFTETHAPYEGVLRLFGPGWGAVDGNIVPIVKVQQLDITSLLTRAQIRDLFKGIAKYNAVYSGQIQNPASPCSVNDGTRSDSNISNAADDGLSSGGIIPTITVVLLAKSFFSKKPVRAGAARYFGYRHDRSDRALQLISDVDPAGRLLQYLTDAVVSIIEQWTSYDVIPPSRATGADSRGESPSNGNRLGGDASQSSRNTTPHKRSPSPRPALEMSVGDISAEVGDGGESADSTRASLEHGAEIRSLEHSFTQGPKTASPRAPLTARGRGSGRLSRTSSNQPIRTSAAVNVSLKGLTDEMNTIRLNTSVALPTLEGGHYVGASVGVAAHLAPTKKKTVLVLLDQDGQSVTTNSGSKARLFAGGVSAARSTLEDIETGSLFGEVINQPSSLDSDIQFHTKDGPLVTNGSFLGKLKTVFGSGEAKQPLLDLMAETVGGNSRTFHDLEGAIGDDAITTNFAFNSDLHPKFKRQGELSKSTEDTNASRTHKLIRSRANSMLNPSPSGTPSYQPNSPLKRSEVSALMFQPPLSGAASSPTDFEEQEERFLTQCSLAMDQMQEVVRTIRSCTEYACEKLQTHAISVRRASFCISLAVESFIHAQLYDGFVFPVFTAMYSNDERQLQATRSRLLASPPTSAQLAVGCDVDASKRGSWINKRTGERVISPCYFGASEEFWKFDPSPYTALVESIFSLALTPFDKLQRIRALFLLVAEQAQRLSTLHRGRHPGEDAAEGEAFDMNDVTDVRWQETDAQAPVNMCADDMVAMFSVVLVWCPCPELYSQMQYLSVFHSEAAEEDSELEYAFVTFRVAVENIILEGGKKEI